LPLAVPLAVSMGDLTTVPSSPLHPMAAHHETLVAGESAQEALEVQAVPTMLVQDGSSAPPLWDVHAQVELDAYGTPVGVVSIMVDKVDPRPGNDVRSPLCDLVMRGASLGMPGRTDPGNGIPTHGSSGAGGQE
jgi:hypothetical protein